MPGGAFRCRVATPTRFGDVHLQRAPPEIQLSEPRVGTRASKGNIDIEARLTGAQWKFVFQE